MTRYIGRTREKGDWDMTEEIVRVAVEKSLQEVSFEDGKLILRGYGIMKHVRAPHTWNVKLSARLVNVNTRRPVKKGQGRHGQAWSGHQS